MVQPEEIWESEGGAIGGVPPVPLDDEDAEALRRAQDQLRRDPRVPPVGTFHVGPDGTTWEVRAVALLEGTGEAVVARYSPTGGSWVGLLDDWVGAYRAVREPGDSFHGW